MYLPTQYLKQAEMEFPGIWRLLDEIAASKGNGLRSWPDWCMMPISATVGVGSRGRMVEELTWQEKYEACQWAMLLSAIYPWRIGKTVLQFDPDVIRAIISTDVDSTLPTEHFFRLPFYSCYVLLTQEVKDVINDTARDHEISKALERAKGFFIYLDYDLNDGSSELRFIMDEGDDFFPVIFLLDKDNSVSSSTRSLVSQHKNTLGIELRGHRSSINTLLAILVRMALYLCAENRETCIDGELCLLARGRPKVRKGKKGRSVIDPSTKPTIVEVGYRIGADLRKSDRYLQATENKANFASTAPHLRKAHFHTFLYGPKKDQEGNQIPKEKRERRLTWLPPIPVGFNKEKSEQLVPTIRRVI